MGPGEGQRVWPAMTLKVGDNSQAWSMFEVAGIGPGFDVGAHLHRNAEELFYVLDGQLDLLAFEPRVRTAGNWQSWQSHTGATAARGGPGSMMYVPRGCPHAFANPGHGPARMIFLVSPSGHEHYQRELAELVGSTTGPLDAAIAELRARHDIEQLTPQVIPGRPLSPAAGLPPAPRLPLAAQSRQSRWPVDRRRYRTCRRIPPGQVREPPLCTPA